MNNKTKINRRNFFYYIGASFAGLSALSSLPFKMFRSKIKKHSSVNITANPHAVKRDMNVRNNG
ncbi:MAG: hypothetical protein ACRDFC_07340 [Ignavibacteria bacterium]